MSLGLYITSIRKQRQVSRKELGEAAGIATSTVGQIERGTIKRPPMKRLKAFAVVLEVHVDHLTAFFVAGIAERKEYGPVENINAPFLPGFVNDITVIHAVMFSGGKDSTCMADLMNCLNMKIDLVLCADLGAEFPEMYQHMELFEQLTGLEIQRINTPNNFNYYFSDYQLKKGKRKGLNGYGWCGKARWGTALKRRAINKALKELRHGNHVIEYHGVSSEETHRFGKCNDGRDIKRPLVDWNITGPQALQWCYDQGYNWGGLYEVLDRVSCWCCENNNLKELTWMYHNRPDLWEKLKQMDSKSPFPFKGVGIEQIEEKIKER